MQGAAGPWATLARLRRRVVRCQVRLLRHARSFSLIRR